mmetsp:Transcript_43155/g.80124  ORF Transcript_43155/g.80124 Transcript_43155/m.80124 type:complete len:200 (-) Transcript_43155:1013-1612(-)
MEGAPRVQLREQLLLPVLLALSLLLLDLPEPSLPMPSHGLVVGPAAVMQRRPSQRVGHVVGSPGISERLEETVVAVLGNDVKDVVVEGVAGVGTESGIEEGSKGRDVRGVHGPEDGCAVGGEAEGGGRRLRLRLLLAPCGAAVGSSKEVVETGRRCRRVTPGLKDGGQAVAGGYVGKDDSVSSDCGTSVANTVAARMVG